VTAAGLIRVTTFHARAGQQGHLVAAAEGNATAARQATGCLSAEVCLHPDEPDVVLVVSRWESAAALREFLDWHEGVAHGAVSPHASGRPQSVHYPAAR